MNARRHVIKHFDPLRCFQKLESIYQEIMDFDKRSRTFNTYIKSNDVLKNDLGARLFIESLGEQGSEFLQSYKLGIKGSNKEINKLIKEVEIGMNAVTKGSLFQYLYYFPNDVFLNFWADLISQVDDNVLKRHNKADSRRAASKVHSKHKN